MKKTIGMKKIWKAIGISGFLFIMINPNIVKLGDCLQIDTLIPATNGNFYNERDIPDQCWELCFYDNFGNGLSSSYWHVYSERYQGNNEVHAYWGFTTHDIGNSVYCAQWGTDGVPAPGPYKKNMRSHMDLNNPVDLSDAYFARVTIYMDALIADGDYFACCASLDNEHFYLVDYAIDYSVSEVVATFNLSNVDQLGNLCGRNAVWIKFYFFSDSNNEVDEGVQFTNVGIEKVVNLPPVAEAGGPYYAQKNTLITFDGSGSYDPDGTIIGYQWDWTNDGIWDTELPTPTATHSYPAEGTYTVKLAVTDGCFVDEDTTTVYVLPGVVYVNTSYSNGGNNGGHTWGYDAFKTIQAGINGVGPAGIVNVAKGTYIEHDINVLRPSIKVLGENRNTTIVDAGGTGDAFKITVNNITISGFTIQNSGDQYVNGDSDAGIDIISDNNTISGNIIGKASDAPHSNRAGVFLSTANHNKIHNNYFYSNRVEGIYQYGYGSTSIGFNYFLTNLVAIDLEYTYDNTIYQNTFESNTLGIDLEQAGSNSIAYNTFSNDGGIFIHNMAHSNRIFRNNFFSSDVFDDVNTNYWYLDQFGGNYWSDYQGVDANHDRIGDSPYEIPPLADLYHIYDQRPWMVPNGWNYHQDGQTCFLGNTPITMADGSLKIIEDIRVGDMVTAYDETNSKLAPSRVTAVFHHAPEEMTEYYLIINKDIRVTPNHRLYLNGKWMTAGDAQLGDHLLGIKGYDVEITSIEKVYTQVPTYNFEVERYHNYFANGILAHNQKQHYEQAPSGVE